MRKPVLPIVAAALLVAACGSEAPAPVAQPSSTSPTTSTTSTTTASPTRTTPLRTMEPTDYASAAIEAGITPTTNADGTPTKDSLFLAEWGKVIEPIAADDGDYLIGKAKETCEQIGQYKGDEAARYVIEEVWEDPAELNLYAKHYCPALLPVFKRAATGFDDGDHVVGTRGEDIVRAGKYRTAPGVRDCYWERVTDGGNTIANDFITQAPKGVTVTIRSSDGGFSSDGCGAWLPVQ